MYLSDLSYHIISKPRGIITENTVFCNAEFFFQLSESEQSNVTVHQHHLVIVYNIILVLEEIWFHLMEKPQHHIWLQTLIIKFAWDKKQVDFHSFHTLSFFFYFFKIVAQVSAYFGPNHVQVNIETKLNIAKNNLNFQYSMEPHF